MDDFNDALMTNDEDIELAARSLKAMSHPIRLKILCALGDDEVSVQDIVDKKDTTQNKDTQQKNNKREKDILITRKDANRVYYRVNDKRTLQLIGMMREVFCRHHRRCRRRLSGVSS